MTVCQINICSAIGKLNFIGAIDIVMYDWLKYPYSPASGTGLKIYGIL